MKQLPIFILLFLFFACKENDQDSYESFENISLTMDTVLVDPKGEIVMVAGELMYADISQDSRFLYNLNPNNSFIEIIDLDDLEFFKRVDFDEEGPDGVGRFPMRIQALSEEEVFVGSFTQKGIYDLDAAKLKDLNFKLDELSGETPNPSYFENSLLVDPRNHHQLFSIWNDWGDGLTLFGIIDTENKTFQNLPIPVFGYLVKFRMILKDGGNPRAVFGEEIKLVISNNTLVISNNIGSDVYLYNLENDILEHKSFDHQVIPSRKTVKMPSQVESMEEFRAHTRKFREDVNFSAPVWDAANERYYRFAFFEKYREVDGKPEFSGVDTYLVLIDKDWNILAEAALGTWPKAPSRHFVKDGKIWIFENMEDEMGFVVMGLSK